MIQSFLASIVLATIPYQAATTPEPVAAWMKTRARELSIGDAKKLRSELSSARSLFEAARIVVVEERVPGARELAHVRGELFRVLVEERGFHVLILDASASACMAIDEWVLGGTGEIAPLLSRLGSAAYDNGEVRAVLEWMRKANQDSARKQKLRVAGLDALDTRAAVLSLQAFMSKIDPDQAERMTAMFSTLRQTDGQGRMRYLTAAPELRRAIGILVEEQLTVLVDLQESYVELTSAAEWEAALESVTLIAEGVELLRSESATGPNERRVRSFLETLERQCSRLSADARAVVWTSGAVLIHDGHAATLAEHAKMRLNDHCMVVTATFDHGAVRELGDAASGAASSGTTPSSSAASGNGASARRELTIEPAAAGSVEHTLAALGYPAALFDLRSPPAGPAADWLGVAHEMRGGRTPGNVESDQPRKVVPARAFDAVLFVARATPVE